MAKKKNTQLGFADFMTEVDDRFASLGMDKNSYGDEIIHRKVDIILYSLSEKGLVTTDELLGPVGEDGKRSGGFAQDFIEKSKALVLSR